jgi:hypothetical protein
MRGLLFFICFDLSLLGQYLQELIRQVGQFGTLSFFKCDMRVETLILKLVYQVRQAVTLCIKVGSIDLVDITCKDHLCVFACA